MNYGFAFLWLAFLAYAVFAAPPDDPNTLDTIVKLSTGNLEGINPLVVALFNLMGIWPMVYCGVLLADGRGQRFPAWPFALLSFGLGAFALLPYLALREPQPEFRGNKDWILRFWDSRLLAIALTVAAFGLIYYGLRYGDLADFAHQLRANRFIHVMSLDFCMLSLLFPWLMGDDMQRRQWESERWFVALSSLPAIGALLYLCLRPRLPELLADTEENT